MMTGMDDREDPGCNITLEAMSGLSSILSQVAEADVRNILINIALRIKPMFEKVCSLEFYFLFKYNFINTIRLGSFKILTSLVHLIHWYFILI